MPKKTTHKRTRSGSTTSTRQRARATATHEEAAKTKNTSLPKNIAVYGMYRDPIHMERGVHTLNDAGFRHLLVSPLALSSGSKTRDIEPSQHRTAGALTAFSGRLVGCLTGVVSMAPLVMAAPVLNALATTAGIRPLPLPDASEGGEHVATSKRGGVLRVECEGLENLQRAAEILESTGARDVAASVGPVSEGAAADRLKTVAQQLDLQSREYRDEEGNIHHHTRTFLEQHGTKDKVA